MKQCPQCRTTYTDDTLRFCLADGSILEEGPETPTAERRGVRIPVEPAATVIMPPARPTAKSGGGSVLKIVIAVVLVAAIAIVAAGAAGALYFMGSATDANTARNTPTPVPTTSPTASPDPEKERLQKELANLQKKLEAEKNANSNSNSKTAPPFETKPEADSGRATARVNSPNDGFLALRDEPDAGSGARLAKIPHGAVVTLENCEKTTSSVGGRTGRWCMVTYKGETGWVFDAFLQY